MSSPHEMRVARRKAAPQLDVRATTVKPQFSQPTDVVALTSTFSGPTSCYENILSMLPPASFIWANEPVPVPNNTVAACYPSEFLESYTPVTITNSGGTLLSSSIVPAMSPFACPKNWCTMFAQSRNYIACCPSDYLFHPPDTTVDPDRPAYGGTCYSDLPVKTAVPVVKFDEKGDTASGAFSQSTSGGQAFAHPIDGWALTSPTIVGCPTTSESLSSDHSSSASSSSNSDSSSTSDVSAGGSSSGLSSATPVPSNNTPVGAIVGATIGGCVGLAAIVALVWFLLRRRRSTNNIPKDAHQVEDDMGNSAPYYHAGNQGAYNMGDYNNSQVLPGTVYAHEKPAQDFGQSRGAGGQDVYEMQAVHAMELPAEQDNGKVGLGVKGVDGFGR